MELVTSTVFCSRTKSSIEFSMTAQKKKMLVLSANDNNCDVQRLRSGVNTQPKSLFS